MPNETLARTIRALTGDPSATPRPGQAALVRDVEAAVRDTTHVAGEAPTGVGKALDVDTLIPIPDGWKRMGDLVAGDAVFDEHGASCKVTEAHAVQYDRPCYDVTFSDGSSIIADGEHLWAVSTRSMRAQQAERVRQPVRYNSAKRYARLLDLERMRESIPAGAVMATVGGASEMLAGLADPTTIIGARKELGMPNLKKGDLFDIGQVIDHMILTTRSNSALARPDLPTSVVLSTEEMRSSLRGQGGGLNYAIGVGGSLKTSVVADLAVPPYTLGAWLGDGTSNSAQIASADIEIIENIVADGFSVKKLKSKFQYSIHVGDTPVNSSYSPNLTGTLRRLGVRKNKHIPQEYLRASFGQRLALLQGLMDTDGTIRPEGLSEFAVCDERLARDAFELVSSLGIIARFSSGPAALTEDDPESPGEKRRRVVGTRYRVRFTTNLPVFRLQRKLDRIPAQVRSTTIRRYIKSITPVPPRPVRCIRVDSESSLFLAGKSMIPTHNTYSLLAPAFHYAVRDGMRTVISTESLSLMEQISTKDAPLVAETVRQMTGTEPTFAVLKGFSNYVCARAANEASDDLAVQSGSTAQLGGRLVDRRNALKLVNWAKRLKTDEAGDRQSYPGTMDAGAWNSVSTGSNECLRDECPFSSMCKPLGARRKAAEADVVITNHSMLAVQAAKGVPVLLGNAQLGDFDIIMVDEAHALPGAVRSQGASAISAARIGSMARALGREMGEASPATRAGFVLATMFAEDTAPFAASLAGDDVHRFKDGDDPLEGSGDGLVAWSKEAKRMIDEEAKSAAPGRQMFLRKLSGRFEELSADANTARRHRTGTARWAGLDKEGHPVVHTALVNVAPLILSNLWRTEVKADEDDAPQPGDPKPLGEDGNEPEEKQYRDLAVVCVSGTLPKGFTRDAGLQATPAGYPSPFDDAYGGSALLIPKLDASEAAQVFSAPGNKFSTAGHRDWAGSYMADLVDRNRGSAIVLAASGANGKEYARRLRESARGWKVLSQWDGKPVGQLVDEWRADETAVMVGTRSLMTGVDAKGSTCSLVVIDRPARSPSNPVDEARVEYLMEALNMDKWSADRLVYVSDAAALAEQAAGRLIRSITDTGVVAFLEPRMLKSSPQSYPAPTRTAYMHAFRRFTNIVLNAEQAQQWMAGKSLQSA